MARTVTVQYLVRAAKRRSGLRGAENLSDPDWLDLLNLAIARVWDSITQGSTGYGQVTATLTATPGSEEIALPAGHQQTIGLLRRSGGNDLLPVERTNEWEYRLQYPSDDTNAVGLPGIYWYRPAAIVLRPVPTTAEELTMVYLQAPPVLAVTPDPLDPLQVSSLDAIADFDDCIVEWACAEAQQDMRKRQAHMARAQQLLAQRVARWGDRRDRGPDYIDRYAPQDRWSRGPALRRL